jgi:hypothetical protein
MPAQAVELWPDRPGRLRAVRHEGIPQRRFFLCEGPLEASSDVWGSLSLKSRDWSMGFGLYEDMEIALDLRVKIASGTRFPDRQGLLCLDLKCYVKMILLALRISDG